MQPSWWDLHVRAARGEELSPAEQVEYEAALRQHDQSPLAQPDLAELKRLRSHAGSLAEENAQLRTRVDALLREIRRMEGNLNEETRQLLGVGE
jgi:hypothetical protein